MPSELRSGDPERLGPYRILGRLGTGGMGTVFLAQDGEGRQVAIKMIRPELADDDSFRARFRSEVTAARRVRRFSTAAVLDAQLEGDPLYVVTEYVDGPTLDEVVAEHGPLSGGALEGLAVNIATALGSIHQAGIVHRDLKPSNVLLASTGPRVIDFGIARALDATQGHTATGGLVGTPAYIAPELIKGGAITPAVDVFAWGCVITYAATGRSPFTGATVHETLNKVTSHEPILDGLDPALALMVGHALAKDPAQRPTTAELLNALVGHAATRAYLPTQAPPAATQPLAPTLIGPPASAEANSRRKKPFATGRRKAILALIGSGTLVALLAAFLLRDDQPPPTIKDTLVHDNFDQPEGPGDLIDHGTLTISTGITNVQGWYTSKGAPDGVIASHPDALADVRMRIARGSASAEAGIYCRSNQAYLDDQTDRYQFVLRKDGIARITRTHNAQTTELSHSDHPVGSRSDFSHLTVVCAQQGNAVRLALWVNGDLATETVDRANPINSTRPDDVGLLVADSNSASDPATALFQNFSLGRP